MTPQELKNSILQLAIQGKLVEQRPEEGTAAESVEKIFAAKNAKSAKKNLTRSRGARGENKTSALSASPREKIPDDEKPFDIPESWEWVRLGEVFQHNTGKALNSSDKTGTPLSYITTSNVYWNRFELGKLKTMLFSESEVEKCTIQKGDLLVLEGGDVGRAAIWNYDFPMRIQNHIHRLRPLIDICVQYVYYIFMLYKNANMISGKGISIKGLSANALHNLLIPLPPLAEQKRIVAKIEELLPLIDRYEKAWSRLEDFNKRFPVDMQKSLLQMAIQGKLVAQRPEEGTGEELLEKILATKNAKSAKKNLTRSRGARGEKATSALPASPREEISDDEKPFDIPEGWKWARLEDISESVNVGIVIRPKRYYVPKGEGTPAFRNCNIQQGFIDAREWVYLSHDAARDNPRAVVKSGDILIARSGTPGNCCVVTESFDGWGAIDIVIVRLRKELASPQYIKAFICAPSTQKAFLYMSRGVALSHLGATTVASLFVPLPPLAEQKRIVAKLAEILPLCERLK